MLVIDICACEVDDDGEMVRDAGEVADVALDELGGAVVVVEDAVGGCGEEGERAAGVDVDGEDELNEMEDEEVEEGGEERPKVRTREERLRGLVFG